MLQGFLLHCRLLKGCSRSPLSLALGGGANCWTSSLCSPDSFSNSCNETCLCFWNGVKTAMMTLAVTFTLITDYNKNCRTQVYETVAPNMLHRIVYTLAPCRHSSFDPSVQPPSTVSISTVWPRAGGPSLKLFELHPQWKILALKQKFRYLHGYKLQLWENSVCAIHIRTSFWILFFDWNLMLSFIIPPLVNCHRDCSWVSNIVGIPNTGIFELHSFYWHTNTGWFSSKAVL